MYSLERGGAENYSRSNAGVLSYVGARGIGDLGIAAYWKMGEASNTARADSLGNHDLAIVNLGTDVSQISGKLGNAMYSTASADYVQTASWIGTPGDTYTARSTFGWVYAETSNVTRQWFGEGVGHGANQIYSNCFYTLTAGGNMEIQWNYQGFPSLSGYPLVSTSAAVSGAPRWVFVCCVVDGGDIYLWTDKTGSLVSVTRTVAEPTRYGSFIEDGYFYGVRSDDWGVSTNSFNQTQVEYLWNNGVGRALY